MPGNGAPMAAFLGALPAGALPWRAIHTRDMPSVDSEVVVEEPSGSYKLRAGASDSVGSRLIHAQSMNIGVNTEF